MNNSNLKTLLNEYENKRLEEIYNAEKRKEKIYTENPRLQEIDDIISKEGIRISMLLINSNDANLLKELNNKIDILKKEKEKILNSIGKTLDDLNPIYECTDCKDTGYILKDYKTEMCHCLKQKLLDLEYNNSNIYNLENQNFDNFLIDYYSNEIDEQKYNAKISPRENIEKIKKLCYRFIENFDDEHEKNLLFTGNTGLGKSFLSSCIANEMLKKGKTVLYQTAPTMLDTVIDYRFGKNSSSKEIYDTLLDVDLLIIDDLGTEFMNSMKFTELFNIINSRLLNTNNKIRKTIISTNLSLQNLYSNYDERIVSRIVGNYNICYFFGDDIRFKKR